ncbi:MAG: hypothetical protein A3H52_00370 [Candidatus Zambryskibacteria bacterium RIFCSPLOWO2_02_FULL_39_26]|nr:MAG: hypothetical protein A2W51_02355 [Candidatus Zambryskibacteria bacterium RIFCSPHIGHO2_02_39_10]OHB09806.1 MAG: hypothetical protein A3H52_00370 [Candidatus Zambryskibacteria bacterium RIFCSPLOWO2_02_FULL_39_26]
MEQENRVSANLNTNNIDPISFFGEDANFVFVYKKTEKLVSAVYMVTNLFSENEPTKWTLRKKAGDLMSFILNYKDINESSCGDFIYNVKTRILELVSLLEISSFGGLLSNMNFTILKKEFSSLVGIMDSEMSNHSGAVDGTIPKSFFNVKEVGLGIKDRYLSSGGGIKDNSLLKSRDQFKRSNRQNIILNLLRKKKELTIKDISAVIKDCSEKTIQRELTSFIKAGVLKRTGERRWSKYSLA